MYDLKFNLLSRISIWLVGPPIHNGRGNQISDDLGFTNSLRE